MLGANDSAEGQVPAHEFQLNLVAICTSLHQLLPSAKLLLVTPPPINNQVWPTSTGNRGHGGSRSLERLKPYVEAMRKAVQTVGAPARLLDLQHDFTTRLMHWADTVHDGFHLSTKGNVFVYRQIGEALRDAGLNPSQLPPKRPPALAAAVDMLDDGDGRYVKAQRKK